MNFIDLSKQQEMIRNDLESRINKVLDHGKYIMGPEVKELEEELAKYIGVKHCVGVSSGTDALLIALMALGVGKDDEVITTPFSFIATAEVIKLIGAKPIFVDIDSDTYNIDYTKIEESITSKTKVIMPVSLYGQCADFDEINSIAKQNGLSVIEDAAQSFGSTYKNRKSCSLSDIGCTSFFPSKPLGCYGDAGACFTDSDELFDKMSSIRLHGQEKRYHHTNIGINGRIDTIQATVLLSKMKIFDDEVKLRSSVAERYNSFFEEAMLNLKTPFLKAYNTSVYAQYTIELKSREKIIKRLSEDGIPTAVHYPVPIHKQPVFSELKLLNLPISELSAERVMSIPMHPYLPEDDQLKIVNCIKKAME